MTSCSSSYEFIIGYSKMCYRSYFQVLETSSQGARYRPGRLGYPARTGADADGDI